MTPIVVRLANGEVSMHRMNFDTQEPLACGLNLTKAKVTYVTQKLPRMLTNEKVCPVCFPGGELPDGL